jgi:DNA-binding transcriptional LysR family regulator
VPTNRPARAAGLDLNLLRVLDALLDERSVTTAAGPVHLSVPATSRALGRLRLALGDELLVRAGRELVLTPRALELRPLVTELLQRAEQLTESAIAFDPARLRQTFAVRVNDTTVLTIGASLLSAVAEVAPGVVLRFLPESDEDPVALRTGLGGADRRTVARPGQLRAPARAAAVRVSDRVACAPRRRSGPRLAAWAGHRAMARRTLRLRIAQLSLIEIALAAGAIVRLCSRPDGPARS